MKSEHCYIQQWNRNIATYLLKNVWRFQRLSVDWQKFRAGITPEQGVIIKFCWVDGYHWTTAKALFGLSEDRKMFPQRLWEDREYRGILIKAFILVNPSWYQMRTFIRNLGEKLRSYIEGFCIEISEIFSEKVSDRDSSVLFPLDICEENGHWDAKSFYRSTIINIKKDISRMKSNKYTFLYRRTLCRI